MGGRKEQSLKGARAHKTVKWTAVWCHERARKADNMELLKSFLERARDTNAELLCFRKAWHFAAWCSTANKPYALFTDWREVKLCVDAINFQGVKHCPIFTAVLCKDARQQRKVQTWVSNLNEMKSSIHIADEWTIPRLFLQASEMLGEPGEVRYRKDGVQTIGKPAEVRYRKDGVQPPEMQVPPTSQTLLMQSASKASHGYQQKTQLKTDAVHLFDVLQQSRLQKGEVQGQQQLLGQPENHKNATAVDGQLVLAPGTFHDAIAAPMAWVWMSSEHRAKVEHALLAAVPDHYED